MSTIITTDNYQRSENLEFVDNLDDWKVHHDDVDPRGYDVKLADGTVVGEVEGLLADVSARRVRYVELELDDAIRREDVGGIFSDDDLYILVPVGIVRIDKVSNSVFIDGLGRDHIVRYPRYNRNRGYTTGYEIDTNDYLAEYHPFGEDYDRNYWSTNEYRSCNRLDEKFYDRRFYRS